MTQRPEAAPRRIAVISPHLDDAVFACGELLAEHPGAVVITALAGRPPACEPITEWDAAAGFHAGDDVVGARREEDRRALRILGATPVWLDFCDDQYGRSPSCGRLSQALGEAVMTARPTAVFIPLGLFHRDHMLTHEAALAAMRRLSLDRAALQTAPARVRQRAGAVTGGSLCPSQNARRATRADDAGLRSYVYADALYRRIPGLVEARVEALACAGLSPTRVRPAVGRGRRAKHRAIVCYRSQLLALQTPGRPGIDDAFAEETYWSLAA
jgi:LmbE family N-acetylglucosaminyl deacetylase